MDEEYLSWGVMEMPLSRRMAAAETEATAAAKTERVLVSILMVVL